MKIPSKTKKLALYGIYAIFSTMGYGYVMFSLYINLNNAFDDFTMLHAYFTNIVAIIGALIVDKIVSNYLSEKYFVANKKRSLVGRFLYYDNLISVKTTLYLFYTFILIASRVSIMQPELISETFRGFVLSIEYCLILVVAFDKFIEHLAKDVKRIKKISDKLKQAEDTEQE